jgi:hypothetical protein
VGRRLLLVAGRARLGGVRLPEAPLALQPAAFRNELERRILVALAGPAGEVLWMMQERSGGYVSTDDQRAVGRVVRKLGLAEHQRALLDSGNDDKRESLSDREKAARLAAALVSEAEVVAYLAWLESSARRLVSDPGFVRLVAALVPVLLEHESVAGGDVQRLFDETSREAFTRVAA